MLFLPSYRDKVREVANLIRDEPMSGLEKAIWWTEYVIRHKGVKHFWHTNVDLPLYQYLLLDTVFKEAESRINKKIRSETKLWWCISPRCLAAALLGGSKKQRPSTGYLVRPRLGALRSLYSSRPLSAYSEKKKKPNLGGSDDLRYLFSQSANMDRIVRGVFRWVEAENASEHTNTLPFFPSEKNSSSRKRYTEVK
ncbi:hypothetical protein NQ317_004016 [Molorchus minor]|uniref:Uncharacterized protein n=1 Tax=Molorchus minor TaxID=1323400 RepID=A0ABQ9JSL6_9CUCU|nr:hypothetical protein NQ317_004016 [Molorchus minor]